MKTLTHLIAAIDFTPCCRNALREAARIASRNQARLTALHVMEEGLANELKTALSTTQAAVRADWEARLQKFVAEADLPPGSVDVEVRIGHPFIEIAEACSVHRTDLLVMGVKGTGGDGHRVGVIAAKCVRKAPVDVLLVNENSAGAFQRIVTCVDFSEHSAHAVRVAAHFAMQDNASLDCLHVYQSALALSLDYGGVATPLPVGADVKTLQTWSQDLEEFVTPLLGDAAATVPVTCDVMERVNIREAIVDHVKERGADLVVLSTRGKTGLRELLIGTTAEKVVANAPCSILAVKPVDFAVQS